MLKSILYIYEGIRVISLLTKKLRGKKVALNYKDLAILLISNWDMIMEAIKKTPFLKKRILDIFSLIRKRK